MSRYGRVIALSGSSQAVTSLANFCVTLYLVRAIDKQEFGSYGVGFALGMLVSALITAGIGVQFVVNVPDQPRDGRANYAVHHVSAIAIFATALIGSVAIIVATLNSMSPVVPAFLQLLLPVAWIGVASGLRDLLTRVAFSERREIVVLGSSAAVAAGAFVSFAVLASLDVALDAYAALYIYAIAQACGCVQGLIALKLPWRAISCHGLRKALTDSWTGGRWSLLTGAVYTIRGQVHNFALPPLLGLTALAEVNAARVLVTPMVMAIPPFMQVLSPRLAERRVCGAPGLIRLAARGTAALMMIGFVYAALLMAVLPWVLPLALGDSYADLAHMVLAWCVAMFLSTARAGIVIALEALKAFRELVLPSLGAAIVALCACFLLAWALGATASIYGLAFAEALFCVVLLSSARRHLEGGVRLRAEQ